MKWRGVLRGAAYGLVGLAVVGVGIWSSLALTFGGPHGSDGNPRLGGLFAVAALVTLGALFTRRWRWRVLAGYLLLFAAVLGWWSQLKPSNDRDWQTGNAVLPEATIDGDKVTIRHIRNFDYRTQDDFTPAYYDRTFDLNKLAGVDLVAVYWMGPAIAHTFVSFEFSDGKRVAMSIETRTTKGDAYSAIKGFFRQYELYYVVADERDVIRLRTNFRHDPDEQVYIYRVNSTPVGRRRVFLQYISKINALKAHPQFYNTILNNCSTDLWANTLVNSDHLPFSWKILASGYGPEYLYDTGRVDHSIPFAELQRRSHVNERAHAANDDPDFSARIRTPDQPTASTPLAEGGFAP